jgi:LmbE family N-acetylglucosaminyl deacetylase
VEFLGHPDGVLEYGVPLRQDITRSIRRHRPEVVITANFQPAWEHGALNQADHIAVGHAVIDAVRDAGNRWVYREQVSEEGLEPWKGVRMVLVAGSPLTAHGVDVSDYFETGMKSLKTHTAYLAGLGDGPMADPSVFLERRARGFGERLDCTYAAAFEVLNF